MKLLHIATFVAIFLAGRVGRSLAGEMKMVMDSNTDPKLFSSRFARYGYNPMKSITTDAKGSVRFKLPSGANGVEETMLYSFFALAGDVEIVAGYEWTNVTPPREGRGVRCGFEVVVDGDPTPASLTLQRVQWPDKKAEGYLVYRGWLSEDRKRAYNDEHFEPTKARNGKLVMRREKDEIVCLVANSQKEEVREICRIPFTEATIRKIRLFVDQGGSPTLLDMKFTGFCVRAEEITGGVPRRDQQFAWGSWLTWSSVVVVGTILLILYRREKRQENGSEVVPRFGLARSPQVMGMGPDACSDLFRYQPTAPLEEGAHSSSRTMPSSPRTKSGPKSLLGVWKPGTISPAKTRWTTARAARSVIV